MTKMTLEQYRRRQVIKSLVTNPYFDDIIKDLDKLGGDWENYATYLYAYAEETKLFEKASPEDRE
jgi:hypothetical protein